MRSILLAMHSIYIRLRLGPAAAPLIVRMRTRLRGVAIVCDYPHPAETLLTHISIKLQYYFHSKFYFFTCLTKTAFQQNKSHHT